MITIGYANRFLKDFVKLPPVLQEEVLEKIELFKNTKNHRQPRVHALHGRLQRRLSFSVSYKYRVIFEYVGKEKKMAILVTIGDHAIYD